MPTQISDGTVILRAFHKQSADNSNHPDEDDICRLAGFGTLPQPLLHTVAKHSDRLHIPTGRWAPVDDGEFKYFLRSGGMTLSRQGRQPQRLEADSFAGRYPLPMDGTWQLSAGPGVTLLKVPARYLDLIRNHNGIHESGIEVHESEAEGQLYMEFHQALKGGKYELPVLPDLAIRIGRAIDDPNTNNDDIARLIQLDPALSARVMSVVNSAALVGAVPLQSLQQAVARLGRKQVRNLVYSCIVKDLFDTDSKILKQQMQELWRHSCQVASISAVLARHTPGMDPDQALLAGLIHDIGAIPLLQTARANADLVDSPVVLERLISEMKAEVGQLTLKSWNFDEEMCRLAYRAEDWFRIGTAMVDYVDIVLVAQLHAFVGQDAGSRYPHIDEIPAFHKLAQGELTPRRSISILEQAANEIDEIQSLLR
jgi:HD-like signal output (HDOD) protein